MLTFLVGKPYWTGAHKAVKHIYWWKKVPLQKCLSLTGCLPKLSSIEIGLLWLLPIRVGANHLRFTIKFVGLESQPQQKVEHYGILQIFVEGERERERERNWIGHKMIVLKDWIYQNPTIMPQILNSGPLSHFLSTVPCLIPNRPV